MSVTCARKPPTEGRSGRNADGESVAQKKRARDWGGRYMRYAASEKHEIIRTVEDSVLGINRNASAVRHSQVDFLQLVRPLSD